MEKKIKLNLADLEVVSLVALPAKELKKVAAGSGRNSSINTHFTEIWECCH